MTRWLARLVITTIPYALELRCLNLSANYIDDVPPQPYLKDVAVGHPLRSGLFPAPVCEVATQGSSAATSGGTHRRVSCHSALVDRALAVVPLAHDSMPPGHSDARCRISRRNPLWAGLTVDLVKALTC